MSDGIGKHWGLVLILSLVLCNPSLVMAGDATAIDQPTLLQQLKSGQKPLIIDVRTAQEYQEGHVPSAINIPHLANDGMAVQLSTAPRFSPLPTLVGR